MNGKSKPIAPLTESERELVAANTGLAYKIALRMATARGLDKDDCCQDGLAGLLRAAKGFRPELGFKFSTYASHWIKQSILRGEPQNDPIHIPAYHRSKTKHAVTAAAKAKFRPFAEQAKRGASISVYDEDPTWSDSDPSRPVDDADDAAYLSFALAAAVASLTPREQEVVTLRKIDGETLDHVSKRFDITRERVRQIERMALDKLARHPALAVYADEA